MAAFSYKKYARAKKTKENKATKVKKQKEYKSKIPCLLNVDYRVFHAWKCCGILSREQLSELGFTNHRLKLYKKSGWIKEVVKNDNNGNQIKGGYLSRDGYEFARKELFMSGFYSPQLSSIEHDLKMGGTYISLTEEERQSWVTETELRTMYSAKVASGEIVEEEGKHYSTCDGAYIDSNGEIQMVEVIGSGYTKAMIVAKKNFCSAMGGNYCEVR